MGKERTYSVKIQDSSKKLSLLEQAMLRDLNDAVKLNDLLSDGNSVIIDYDYHVTLAVHNEKSDNKDYEVYVVADKDGQLYYTSSASFMNKLEDILDFIADNQADGETMEWHLKVMKKPSNKSGTQDFITCTVIQ